MAPAVIQFTALNGTFTANVTDPSGNPLEVIDIDLPFTVSGTIQLPTFLTGLGVVTVYADELGGPIDKSIGQQAVNLTGVSGATDPPGLASYNYSIVVGTAQLPDPSPNSSIYKMAVSFAYQNPPGSHTDIAAVIDLGLFFVV
jgi:hypothetical protein